MMLAELHYAPKTRVEIPQSSSLGTTLSDHPFKTCYIEVDKLFTLSIHIKREKKT